MNLSTLLAEACRSVEIQACWDKPPFSSWYYRAKGKLQQTKFELTKSSDLYNHIEMLISDLKTANDEFYRSADDLSDVELSEATEVLGQMSEEISIYQGIARAIEALERFEGGE